MLNCILEIKKKQTFTAFSFFNFHCKDFPLKIQVLTVAVTIYSAMKEPLI